MDVRAVSSPGGGHMTGLPPDRTLADVAPAFTVRIRNVHAAKSSEDVHNQPLAAIAADHFSWLLMSDLIKCRLFVFLKVKGPRRYL